MPASNKTSSTQKQAAEVSAKNQADVAPEKQQDSKQKSSGKVPPRDSNFEMGLPMFGKHGYNYISDKCKEMNTDIFQGRMGIYKAYFMTGEDASRLFYDRKLFHRENVMPFFIRKTLLGEGGVHYLDGEAHHHRKAAFMNIMTRDNLKFFSECMVDSWEKQIASWPDKKEIVFLDETCEVITRAVCRWSDVPMQESELPKKAKQIFALIDGFSNPSAPRNWKGMFSRKHADKWMKGFVEQVRNGELKPRENSALYAMSFHKDLEGNLLSAHDAAVEVLNVVRPTVAVTISIAFMALALHEHPEFKKQLLDAQAESPEAARKSQINFCQEVRRFYPFTPLAGARPRQDVELNGYIIPKDQLCIFDAYGTLHDERYWKNGNEFNPDRFNDWTPNAFTFCPNSGGEIDLGHRCAGEHIQVNTMRIALDVLLNRVEYTVPENQDLTVRITRIPTYPKSGFKMSNISIVDHKQEEVAEQFARETVTVQELKKLQGVDKASDAEREKQAKGDL